VTIVFHLNIYEINTDMNMTLIIYKITLPDGLDAGLFDDISNFLSLDVSYEAQQATVEFISKLHTGIDKFTTVQTDPIMTNLRIYHDLEGKQTVLLAVGFVDQDWYQNTFITAQETIEAVAALDTWTAAYGMTIDEVRTNDIEVEFFPESCVYLGLPVNYPELRYLYDSGTTFASPF
jgi:hypothetical protein